MAAKLEVESVATVESPTRRSRDIQRRQRVMEHLQSVLNPIWEQTSAADIEQIALRIERAASQTRQTSEQDELIQALTQGRTYSAEEHVLLEFENHVRSFQDRRNLLQGAFTSSQVAALLGTSRQTPHDRANTDTLLALSDQGKLLFPPWQFDPDGPHGVVNGLPQVLKALHVSPFSKARWLMRPNPTFDNQSPLDLLKQGEIQRVVDAAQAVGVA